MSTLNRPVRKARVIGLAVLASWGYFAVSLVTGFIQVHVLLSYLPDVQAGTWFVILSFLTYIALLDFGTGVTLARYVAFAHGNKYVDGWIPGESHFGLDMSQMAVADLVATVAKSYRVVAVVVGLVSAIVGMRLLPLITGQPLTPELIIVWLLAALTGCLALMNIAPSATLYGSNALHYQQFIAMIGRVGGMFLIIGCLAMGWGMIGVALSVVVQYAAVLLMNWQMVRRLYPFLRLPGVGRSQMILAKKMIGPSLKMGMITLASAGILLADNLLISIGLGPQAVPNYNAMFQLAFTLYSLALVISTPIVALSARAYAENSSHQLIELLGVNLRFGLSFMLVGVTLLSVFGKEIIEVWIGPGRFVGYPVMIVMLLVMTLEVHTIFHFRVVTATNRIPFVPWTVAAAVLNIGLSLILVGIWGWLGVILGTLAAQLVTNYWFVPYYTHRALGVSRQEYRAWLVPLMVLALGLAFLGWLVRSVIMAPTLGYPIIIQFLIGGLIISIPAALWFFFRVLLPNERIYLKTIFLAMPVLKRLNLARTETFIVPSPHDQHDNL